MNKKDRIGKALKQIEREKKSSGIYVTIVPFISLFLCISTYIVLQPLSSYGVVGGTRRDPFFLVVGKLIAAGLRSLNLVQSLSVHIIVLMTIVRAQGEKHHLYRA